MRKYNRNLALPRELADWARIAAKPYIPNNQLVLRLLEGF